MIECETIRFEIQEESAGARIDKALVSMTEDLSRERLQSLMRDGNVTLNAQPILKPSRKVEAGDILEIKIPPPISAVPEPENIALNIVYEDDDLIVLNKQAGLVVHPGAGHLSGTLVNALLHHCGDSLSGIGGVMRPGIVHRLDKDTSGLMVVAKHDRAHQGLSEQLQQRSVKRYYKALVLGKPQPLAGLVDAPIGRHRTQRRKMSVDRRAGKQARTHFKTLSSYQDVLSLVECRLESGRTHQIRVHMAYLKYYLVGDPAYGPQPTALQAALKRGGYDEDCAQYVMDFPRQALHAYFLHLIHPCNGQEMIFEQPLAQDFYNLLKKLEK